MLQRAGFQRNLRGITRAESTSVWKYETFSFQRDNVSFTSHDDRVRHRPNYCTAVFRWIYLRVLHPLDGEEGVGLSGGATVGHARAIRNDGPGRFVRARIGALLRSCNAVEAQPNRVGTFRSVWRILVICTFAAAVLLAATFAMLILIFFAAHGRGLLGYIAIHGNEKAKNMSCCPLKQSRINYRRSM